VNEPNFLKTTTILPVKDLYETLTWYQDILGFKNVYVHGEGQRGEVEDFANYAISRRDLVEVHFIMDEGGPVWTRAGTGQLHLTVRDVEAVYAEVQSRGGAIARGLQRENWPARGFDLTDPSGNHVHVEQPD
jgi:uncharacterized glyoxalase superfamily protein PhnB